MCEKGGSGKGVWGEEALSGRVGAGAAVREKRWSGKGMGGEEAAAGGEGGRMRAAPPVTSLEAAAERRDAVTGRRDLAPSDEAPRSRAE